MDLAPYIDHTLLKPDAKESEIIQLCAEAKQFGFHTVCIEAKWLALAVRELKGSRVLPITVVSFPGGRDSTDSKVSQVRAALAAGAGEIDMVLNRESLAQFRYADVYQDISAVVAASSGRPVKVILETSELTEYQKVAASALCKAAGASFVKTSTGFSKSGATLEDVRLMRSVVGPGFGVKASGGIRTTQDALKMVEAGATRLGTSASVAIVQGVAASVGGY